MVALNLAQQAPTEQQQQQPQQLPQAPTVEVPADNPDTEVAQTALGGMSFGRALNPKGDTSQQDQLDAAAQNSRRFALAFSYTDTGMEKLKERRALKLETEITAPSFLDLYAAHGKKPDAATLERIQRLQVLEDQDRASTAAPLHMQVAPIQTKEEIAKLRSQLNEDTRDMRVLGQKRAVAQLKRGIHEDEKVVADAEEAGILDTKTDDDLRKALITNKPESIGANVSNSGIMEELKRRATKGFAVGAAAPTDPKQRAIALERQLGFMPDASLNEAEKYVTTGAALAYQTRNGVSALVSAGETDPQKLAIEKERDDAWNSMTNKLNYLTGGLRPTIDEIQAHRVQRYDRAQKLGQSPTEYRNTEQLLSALGSGDSRETQTRLQLAAEAGVQIDTGTALLNDHAISAAHTAAITAPNAKMREEAMKTLRDARDRQSKFFDDSIEQTTSEPATKLALKNFARTGMIASSADAANLLANAQVNGTTGWAYKQRELMVIDPASNMMAKTSFNMQNAAKSADAVIQKALEETVKGLDSPSTQARVMSRGKGPDGKPQTGLIPAERDEGQWATAYKALPQEVRDRARQEYHRVQLDNALVHTLLDNIGNSPADIELFKTFVKTDAQTGAHLSSALYTVDAKTRQSFVDLSKLADSLAGMGRTDIAEKMYMALTDHNKRSDLASQLKPGNLREKALFALITPNLSYIQIHKDDMLSATGGRLRTTTDRMNDYVYSMTKVIDPAAALLDKWVTANKGQQGAERQKARVEMHTPFDAATAVHSPGSDPYNGALAQDPNEIARAGIANVLRGGK